MFFWLTTRVPFEVWCSSEAATSLCCLFLLEWSERVKNNASELKYKKLSKMFWEFLPSLIKFSPPWCLWLLSLGLRGLLLLKKCILTDCLGLIGPLDTSWLVSLRPSEWSISFTHWFFCPCILRFMELDVSKHRFCSQTLERSKWLVFHIFSTLFFSLCSVRKNKTIMC